LVVVIATSTVGVRALLVVAHDTDSTSSSRTMHARRGGGGRARRAWSTVVHVKHVWTRYWPLVRRRLFDVVIVLGAGLGVIEAVVRRNADDAPTSGLWLVIVVQLVLTLPLLARKQHRFFVPVGLIVTAGALSFVDGEIVPFTFSVFLAILSSCFLLGMLEDRRQAVAGIAIAVAVGMVAVRNDPNRVTEDFVFIPLLFTIVWLAGLALGLTLLQAEAAHERARRAELEREEKAERAVADERQRIARELHDVVAHSVSVMTVQAGGVRRLLRSDQEREQEALATIEATGRQALADMRRMLGVLRDANEQPALLTPQPSMGGLGTLIQQAREAGLPVEYRVTGEPRPLPPGVDLSAYRIVQEALTNALKHAGPGRAEVNVSYGDVLELEITNDGRIDGNGEAESGGQGLVGMRERVALFGGTLEAGPRHGGGFAVRARLPVGDAAE
jgi:signal transduction histidine kinase